ncbi:MAG: FHA domain-containing protein [Nitrospirae bacterium]|nr:FHA domain-containing protein [Nitrospirota bacterium]MBF0590988.1 FHA domain-containing protein [Nitrospirota bacterium]
MMETRLTVVLVLAAIAIVVGIGILVLVKRRASLAGSGGRHGNISESDTLKYVPVLQCLSGEYEGAVIPMDKQIIIGRDPAVASVVLHSIEISRSHMNVMYQSATGTFLINDLDSKNGVYVARAGEKQFKKVNNTVLREGDRFIVGLRVAEFEVKKQLMDSRSDG